MSDDSELLKRLVAFAEDVMLYGARHDLTPTRVFDCKDDAVLNEISFFYRYLKSIDSTLRDRARQALGLG